MATAPETHTAVNDQQQGTHHWIITLDLPGRASNTSHGTWTPPAGLTRYDAFMAIKNYIAKKHPEMAGANVTFFSLEPNQI